MHSGPFEIQAESRGAFKVCEGDRVCRTVQGDFLSCFYDDSLMVLFVSYLHMHHLAMQAFAASESPASESDLQRFTGLISQIDFCSKRECSVIALNDGLTVVDSEQNQYLLHKIVKDAEDQIHVVPFSDGDEDLEFICANEVPTLMHPKDDWTWVHDASFVEESKTSLFSKGTAIPEALRKLVKSYIDSGEAMPNEVYKTTTIDFGQAEVQVYVFPRLEFSALIWGDKAEFVPAAFVKFTPDAKGSWYAYTREELYHLELHPFKCELIIPAKGESLVRHMMITTRGIELPFASGITEVVKDVVVHPNCLEVYFNSGMKATVQEKAYPVRCLLSYYL